MATILEALTAGERQIKNKLDPQVLLAHVLGKPTSYLFGHMTDELSADDQDAYQRLIDRRARREPVAYLTGKKEFFGRPFFVTPDVLIPRPETEHVVEAALESVAGAGSSRPLIVDVGTGSGAIAVSLAAELNRPVTATEMSARSLSVARRNATEQHVEHLVDFRQGDLLEPAADQLPADHLIVVANLPYLPDRYRQSMDRDVLDYEPHHALFAGIDGLDLYDRLLGQIERARSIAPQRRIDMIFEIDPSQSRSLPTLIRDHFPAAQIDVLPDLSRRPRVVVAEI